MNINNDSRDTATPTFSFKKEGLSPQQEAHADAMVEFMTRNHIDVMRNVIATIIAGIAPESTFRLMDSALCGAIQYHTAKFGGFHYVEAVRLCQHVGAEEKMFNASILSSLAEGVIQFNPANMTFAWRFDKINREVCQRMEDYLSAKKGKERVDLFADGRIRVLEDLELRMKDNPVAQTLYKELCNNFNTECDWLVKFGMQPNPEAFTNS